YYRVRKGATRGREQSCSALDLLRRPKACGLRSDETGIARMTGGTVGCWDRLEGMQRSVKRPDPDDEPVRGLAACQARAFGALSVLRLQFLEVGYQFGLGGPTHEEVADHLVGPQGRLPARVQANQPTGDD